MVNWIARIGENLGYKSAPAATVARAPSVPLAEELAALDTLEINQSVRIRGVVVYRLRNELGRRIYFFTHGKEFPDSGALLRYLS